jgi:hypothetical protein
MTVLRLILAAGLSEVFPVSASSTPAADPDEEAEIPAEMNQDEETEEEDEALVAS